jgi:DNA-binding transcriptional LysR family regulator
VRLRAAARTRASWRWRLLSEFPLLHQSTRIHGWQEWFALSNITSPQINIGPRFDLLSMLIAAVRSNLGVALLRVLPFNMTWIAARW